MSAGTGDCEKAFLNNLWLGDSAGVVECLDQGADVNHVFEEGTALAIAMMQAWAYGRLGVVSLLLDRGADVNAHAVSSSYGNALCAVAYGGKGIIVKLLLDRGADANAFAVSGNYGSALCAAACGGWELIVGLLLDRGADPNACAASGSYGTALCAAACWGREKVVELLLDREADVNALAASGSYGTALCAAAYGGKETIVRLLLDRGADPNACTVSGSYGTALCAAACGRWERIVRLLLDGGADVNAHAVSGSYGNALCAAAYGGRVAIVELLLDRGLNVNSATTGRYGTALCAAACGGWEEVVSLLLDRGADVRLVGGTEYGTALGAAVRHNKQEVISLLLDELISGNTVDVGGKYGSVLGAAAYYGDTRTVSLLLSKGVGASYVGGYYKTKSGTYPNALDAATSEGSKATQPLLAMLKAAVAKQSTSSSTMHTDSANMITEQTDLIARPPFPMPYTYDVGSSSDGRAQLPSIVLQAGESIEPEHANILCKEFERGALFRLLAALTGLHADTMELLQAWLQNDIRYFVARNFDLGTAYAAARVAWKNFNDGVGDDNISIQRAHWHWQAKQFDDARSGAIYVDEYSKQEVIDSPYSIMPRRIWDLKCNRVIDFRMLYSASLAMQVSTDLDVKSRPPAYWAVSHSWADDLHSDKTSVNQFQWPVPLPQRIYVSSLRYELLGYGAEYVWLDVLCLRQHSENDALNLLKKEEWKLDVPTIGNIYRAAGRIVRYFNGVGREFRSDGWDNDRHWLKRAWTLQEIRAEHITINGGVPRDRDPILMNSRGTIKKIENGKEVQVETTLRRAMRPVLLLASEVDSPRGCKMYELAKEMAGRKASTPLDRVSGLFYLLRITRLPCYEEGVGPGGFWRDCFGLLPAERKLELLFDYPYRGSEEQWFPTWPQIMAWPEKDPDYEHIPIEWSGTRKRQYLGRDLFQAWSVSAAILHQTGDPSEYVVKAGGKIFGFYSPYRSQRPIQLNLQSQHLEVTLLISNPEGHAYNWLVCEHIGKQFTQGKSGGPNYEYIVLRKVGILRTDALSEILVGGKDGKSMLVPIYAQII